MSTRHMRAHLVDVMQGDGVPSEVEVCERDARERERERDH